MSTDALHMRYTLIQNENNGLRLSNFRRMQKQNKTNKQEPQKQ